MKRNYIEDKPGSEPEAAPEIRDAASDSNAAIRKTPKQPVTLIVVSDMRLETLFKPQPDVMIRSASSTWSGFNGGGSVSPLNLITAFLSTALQRLSVPPPLPSRAALDVAVMDPLGEPVIFPLIAYVCPAFRAMMPQVAPASPALP